MDIPSDIGRDFIRGGEWAGHSSHLELDSACVRFLDLAGVGADGDLIGDTEGCSTAEGPMSFGAMRFTIAILFHAGIIADSDGPASAARRTRADFQTPKTVEEIRQARVPAVLAGCSMAATCAGSLRADDPAWAAEFLAVAEEDMVAAGTADVDIDN